MRLLLILSIIFICSCGEKKKESIYLQHTRSGGFSVSPASENLSYADKKKQINNNRKKLAARYLQTLQKDQGKVNDQIKNFWAASISDLYNYWAGTPWDFNGTTLVPKQGSIACGYFVTTMLLDMGLPINRVKLSTCAASEMMQKLTPHQPIKKLNSLTYNQFCNYLKDGGQNVYIIGLDYHVGFIVNDGQNTWFIHSNYINKQGVIKEEVQYSIALKASKTRWLIKLTNDSDFISRWLTAKA